EREAEQNAGRDGDRVASGHGPTPAAGLMISTVSAIFSALRCAMLAFAAARATRRRPFSAMLAGRSRSWRAFSRAVTPAIPAVARLVSAGWGEASVGQQAVPPHLPQAVIDIVE